MILKMATWTKLMFSRKNILEKKWKSSFTSESWSLENEDFKNIFEETKEARVVLNSNEKNWKIFLKTISRINPRMQWIWNTWQSVICQAMLGGHTSSSRSVTQRGSKYPLDYLPLSGCWIWGWGTYFHTEFNNPDSTLTHRGLPPLSRMPFY